MLSNPRALLPGLRLPEAGGARAAAGWPGARADVPPRGAAPGMLRSHSERLQRRLPQTERPTEHTVALDAATPCDHVRVI